MISNSKKYLRKSTDARFSNNSSVANNKFKNLNELGIFEYITNNTNITKTNNTISDNSKINFFSNKNSIKDNTFHKINLDVEPKSLFKKISYKRETIFKKPSNFAISKKELAKESQKNIFKIKNSTYIINNNIESENIIASKKNIKKDDSAKLTINNIFMSYEINLLTTRLYNILKFIMLKYNKNNIKRIIKIIHNMIELNCDHNKDTLKTFFTNTFLTNLKFSKVSQIFYKEITKSHVFINNKAKSHKRLTPIATTINKLLNRKNKNNNSSLKTYASKLSISKFENKIFNTDIINDVIILTSKLEEYYTTLKSEANVNLMNSINKYFSNKSNSSVLRSFKNMIKNKNILSDYNLPYNVIPKYLAADVNNNINYLNIIYNNIN